MTTHKIVPLPCPFCGSTNIGDDQTVTYSIDSSYDTFGCLDCCAVFVNGDCADWNRRAAAPPTSLVTIEAERLVELERDAARYRWLREFGDDAYHKNLADIWVYYDGFHMVRGDVLDREVDNARGAK